MTTIDKMKAVIRLALRDEVLDHLQLVASVKRKGYITSTFNSIEYSKALKEMYADKEIEFWDSPDEGLLFYRLLN